MYKITVNGKECVSEENYNLLEYLRMSLKLTATKNACGEGSCGACSVIVDGRITKACLQTLEKVNGKSIITVEGLSQKEKEVYGYAFAYAGAVQCGFCIPGMVMAAKVLIDSCLNASRVPSVDEVKKAINQNICRCTGYKKIIDAIILSAKIFLGEESIKSFSGVAKIGVDFPRVDALEKTLGTALYTDDLEVENMLYGGAVRSKYPRAIVKSIDCSKALAIDGVVKIITAKDVIGKRYIAHLAFISDWPILIDINEPTRYLGDAIVLIAAKSKKALERAKELVEIEYEVLPPIDTIEKSKNDADTLVHPNRKEKGGNILAHRHLKRGDAEAEIKKAKYVVTNHYSLPATEHAFMEPESSIAIREGDTIKVYTGGQNVYDEQREIAEVLGIDESKVRCIAKYVGGGFGGKEDMSVQHHAALLSWLTEQPVKITMTRAESMLTHPKRHPMEIDFTTACDENGIIKAVKAVIQADTGAYASLGGPVLERACTHASGPYKIENIDIEGTAFYTNNVPCGAFRGFGVCQSNFASEANINQLARMIGISEWEIRFRNAVEDNDTLPSGQIVSKGCGFKDTLLSVKDDFYRYYASKDKFIGIASALKNSGIGMSLEDTGRCKLDIEDGKIYIKSAAACIGQGIATVMLQVASETLCIEYDNFVIVEPDTLNTPNSGTTTASRQTLFTGEAVRIASLKLKEALKTKSIKELNGESFFGEYSPKTDPLNSDKENPSHHVSFGYATHVVILDDKGRIEKVIASHDVGRIINPKSLEGQIEGGVVMSLGYALTEDYPQKESYPLYTKYAKLKLFRATQVPEIEVIKIEKSDYDKEAYGAKGVGEIASIPTAAAIQDAYQKFDGVFRLSLPLKNTAYLI